MEMHSHETSVLAAKAASILGSKTLPGHILGLEIDSLFGADAQAFMVKYVEVMSIVTDATGIWGEDYVEIPNGVTPPKGFYTFYREGQASLRPANFKAEFGPFEIPIDAHS